MADRRRFLQWTAAAAASAASGWLAVAPGVALAAAATQRRFVFIIQRGAADGLETLIPYADPGYARLRGALAIDVAAAHRLDGSFALHPGLAETAAMYGRGEALLLHAVASPYGDRSHFDGQNVLESGGTAPGQLRDGWLNRLVGLLPAVGHEAIAFAPTVPLALRGPREVTSYSAAGSPGASDDLLLRVGALYQGDAQLHALWQAALDAREIAHDGSDASAMGGGRVRTDGAAIGKLAANFLARPDGPRVAMIETNGWDTHSAQNARLAGRLRDLDALLAALRDGLGTAWTDTVVLVATEFGRTAAANGTGGTDHGSGAVAMLVGGAVQGGRVLTDWPGLGPGNLLDGRDLRSTLSLDAVIAAAAGECYGMALARVRGTLFPRGDGLRAGPGGKPLPRLLRA